MAVAARLPVRTRADHGEGRGIRAVASSPLARQRLRRMAAIDALAVEDAEGRRWVRLAEPFRETAPLCQASAIVDVRGVPHEATCLNRVLWTTRDGLGVCGEHIELRLILA